MDRRSKRFLVSLESPGPHEIGTASRAALFTGFALRLDGPAFASLEVQVAGRVFGRFPIDQPSPDLHVHLPSCLGSDRCRFSFELDLPVDLPELVLVGLTADGEGQELLRYPWLQLHEEEPRLRAFAEQLRSVPVPPSELIALTQGGGDQEAYTRSILAGEWRTRTYLEAAGHHPDQLRSILDLGCGTGRLLLGWWLADPRRTIRGYDIDASLVDWSREHLPSPIEVSQSALEPPLEWPEGSFDLIQCVSVFTHLSAPLQRAWIRELHRLLRPGGVLLLTLHGRLYVELLAPPEGREAFARDGYWEARNGGEGSSQFGTFHSRQKAAELLSEFAGTIHLPCGSVDAGFPVFPIAMFQDVWIATKGPSSSASAIG